MQIVLYLVLNFFSSDSFFINDTILFLPKIVLSKIEFFLGTNNFIFSHNFSSRDKRIFSMITWALFVLIIMVR